MKRSNFKWAAVRFAAVALVLCTCISLFSACSEQERETSADTSPIFECDGIELPLFFYEFMMSRVKGSLSRNQQKVTDPDFWSTVIEGDGRTYEEFYNEYVLERCKYYLAALVIFEQEGLTLPKSKLEEIEEEVQFYIEYDGKGSEDDFSASIKKLGVDAEALRRCYVIEAKYEYLMNYLYGDGELIGDVVRDGYYKDNYIRFKQILFRKYKYEYQYDKDGNLMYFDPSTGKPVYDTENGGVKYENGNRIRDSYGVTIYYDETGKILYDTQKGRPSEKLDEKGNAIKIYYGDADLYSRLAMANEIAASITKDDYAAFEAKLAEVNEEEMIFENYTDGYYLSRLEEENYFEYEYIKVILAGLEDMDDGEVAVIESEHGYHVVMRYELDDAKYNDSEYSYWFGDLDNKIILDLFRKKIENVLPEIVANEENIAKARSITRVGINYDY